MMIPVRLTTLWNLQPKYFNGFAATHAIVGGADKINWRVFPVCT